MLSLTDEEFDSLVTVGDAVLVTDIIDTNGTVVDI